MKFSVALTIAAVGGSAMAANVRLSNDTAGGYKSVYTIATGQMYSDAVLDECSQARGRQNEPAVAVDPRNTNVLVGSSNDYCGVYAGSTPGHFVASGPIWLGYYRSESGGATFHSSLVPGYPGDTSPYAARAQVRTAGAGDPVIAWDGHGRVFMGSESSGDPAGSKKTFGDVWVATFANPGGEAGNTLNDGKEFIQSVVVAKGSSAPNLLGKFHDKTSIEADRTGGTCDGNVYFAWSRFTGFGTNNVYFARSTDHGRTWSMPQLLTPATLAVQDPDISVTGNGHVYVTYRQFGFAKREPDGVAYVKSTDCGRTFSRPALVTTFTPYEPQDQLVSGGYARDCGDFSNACRSGFTFFRNGTTPRSTADQYDGTHENVYVVYEASKPGTQTMTGSTYGSIGRGIGSQAGVYFVRLDGTTGSVSTSVLVDNQARGHQVFPDISADGGILHVIWWDTRSDESYSPARPVGNDASGHVSAVLEVRATQSTDAGQTWAASSIISDMPTNPNYEQFDDRTVPFAGDYLWVTSLGAFSFATWTDWRNTVPGADPREVPDDNDAADVMQCRDPLPNGGWSGDQCPRAGGLDQNIYGNAAP